MKTILLNIAMTCGAFFGFNQLYGQEEVANAPQISFVKDKHDFGEVPFRGNTTYTFEFVNAGNEPLIIQRVQSSCSCTVADWSKEPIAPGGKGSIKVKYDSNRAGPFTKTFSVTTNVASDPVKILTIKGNVLPAKESPVESVPVSTN
jgi:hypothetical protein